MKTAIHLTRVISFIMPLVLCFVMSFKTNAQDYTITTTGNTIVITDVSGSGETLAVTQSPGSMRFVVTPTTRTYSTNGGAITAFSTPADVALTGITGVTINTGAGDDVINMGVFTATLPNLTINGGAGNDAVNFNGSINFASGANLDVDMQNDNASPGIDNVVFGSGPQLVLSGTGAATIKVSKNIDFQPGTLLRTVDGNLTIEANQQATPVPGNFIGVNLTFNTTVEATGTGVVTVKGKGGDINNDNYGVAVGSTGAKISGGTTGSVNITGTGGASTGNFNHGVMVDKEHALITSTGGIVNITGQGGGIDASNNNFGVYVAGGGNITAGGTGTVTVLGTGGSSTGGSNYGVEVAGSGGVGTSITSGGGNVNVTGQGGNGTSGLGVVLNGGLITAGGSGNVTVLGTGGAAPGSNGNHGVHLSNTGIIASAGGNVNVNGQGGTGSSSNAWGVSVSAGGIITAGGTGAVTVQGTGGPGTGGHGIAVYNTGSMITSSGGNISVTGTKGSNNVNDADVILVAGGVITTAGTDGNITITGTSGGVWPNTSGTDVSTIATKTLSFGNNSRLNIEIDGTTVDAQYQQLKVEGLINLNNATLTFNGSSLTPVVGQSFTIVDNDGADAIIGSFAGLSQGAAISNFRGSSLSAIITYVGGTGNDVVLTVFNPCTNPTIPTLAATANPVCSGTSTTLSIQTGNLNSATNWQWYSGSCGGTAVGSGTSKNVSPSGTTTYFVRGEGGCVTPGSCASITVTVNAPQTWYLDADNDGHYVSTQSSCGSPGTGYNQTATQSGDCNDNDNTKWRSASLYIDIDGDGYDAGQATLCYGATIPSGYKPSTLGSDCNDNNAAAHATQIWYLDADNDGHYVNSQSSCGSPGTGYNTTAVQGGDCNDNDNTKWQSASLYIDNDGDGYDAGQATVCYGATIPSGYKASTLGSDCNDNNAAAHATQTWYLDADNDGHYVSSQASCGSPGAGYNTTATQSGDCNDSDPAIHPGATEVLNGKDDNCDGNIDEGFCTSPVITDVTDITSTRATIHWNPVASATSYVTRKYPTGTTNYSYSYHAPITGTFHRVINMLQNTPYSVQVKSICNGGTDSSDWSAPFDFVTLDNCLPPSSLNVTNITATRATLNWSLPLSSPVGLQMFYRPIGTTTWRTRRLPTRVSYPLKNLVGNTEFEWRIRSFCTNDTSTWATGPNFMTASAFASSSTTTVNNSKTVDNVSVQVMPNPSSGNFKIQMQLPVNKAATTLELFDGLGQKIWQADLGVVSGNIRKNVYLGNKTTAGVYVLMIQRNDVRYATKIVISK